MLSPGELASMRETLEASLPGTAVIQTRTVTSDGGGGGSATWSASGTVPCRLGPGVRQGEGEQVDGDRVTPDAQALVTVPFDAEVTESQRLAINGAVYSVTRVSDRDWKIGTRIEVRRLD